MFDLIEILIFLVKKKRKKLFIASKLNFKCKNDRTLLQAFKQLKFRKIHWNKFECPPINIKYPTNITKKCVFVCIMF